MEYTDVLIKGDFIEYYDVSGCYIIKPNACFIWNEIKKYLNDRIAAMNVREAIFPLFVTKEKLESEKNHIEGFAAEVAWLQDKPIAIRPTSETIIYPLFAKWVRSHADLPMKYNQWANVVRWEFKHPTPFIRSREFQWQEGHCAFDKRSDAISDAHIIIRLYQQVYEHLLAVPVIMGRKTCDEKFAGADDTLTVETFVGRGIQCATSHYLGQNFSKIFNIKSAKNKYVYQTSWGMSTRSIGTCIMTHSDAKGAMLPPLVAPIQIVIIPISTSANATCKSLYNSELKDYYRVHIDDRKNKKPGWKYNHWEQKGVPLRVEVGDKNIMNGTMTICRRDTGEKKDIVVDDVLDYIANILETIQSDMFKEARDRLNAKIKKPTTVEEFTKEIESNNMCLIPWSDKSDADVPVGTAMCIPFDQPDMPSGMKTFYGDDATCWCLFGKTY